MQSFIDLLVDLNVDGFDSDYDGGLEMNSDPKEVDGLDFQELHHLMILSVNAVLLAPSDWPKLVL